MVLINIHNFVFSPYKIKSHVLVPIKFSINIFSPIKFSINILSPYKKISLAFFLVPKMLKENVTGTKIYDFIL